MVTIISGFLELMITLSFHLRFLSKKCDNLYFYNEIHKTSWFSKKCKKLTLKKVTGSILLHTSFPHFLHILSTFCSIFLYMYIPDKWIFTMFTTYLTKYPIQLASNIFYKHNIWPVATWNPQYLISNTAQVKTDSIPCQTFENWSGIRKNLWMQLHALHATLLWAVTFLR